MYEKYGVELVATTDTGLPNFTRVSDGSDIPKAWLSHNGIQYLCLDHDKGIAVGLQNRNDKNWNQVPTNIASRAKVYWASHRAMPVGGVVKMWAPADLTEQEHDYVAVLKKLSRATCALEGYTDAINVSHPTWTVSQLKTFMAANPDPSSAMQALPHSVARQLVYTPSAWLQRECTNLAFITWNSSNYKG